MVLWRLSVKKPVRRLPSSDILLLAEALLTVSAVRVALWLFPFRFVHGWLSRIKRDLLSRRIRIHSGVGRVVWAVRVVSRVVPRATCLTQAIAAQLLLALAGEPSTLRIGVARRDKGAFEAHAWIEHDDTIIIGGSTRKGFTPLPELSEVEH
jgi:hypothetical protein